jgi:hypothetical protein
MMRLFYYDLQIDDNPILVPDSDVKIEHTDLDSEESGRDENGFMHRIVLRRGVMTVALNYATLTTYDYRYMESLFAGKDHFEVKYRDRDGNPASCTAYRSKHSITIHNAQKGIYKNYAFNIIEC